MENPGFRAIQEAARSCSNAIRQIIVRNSQKQTVKGQETHRFINTCTRADDIYFSKLLFCNLEHLL